MHVNDIILNINRVFVQIRSGCCGNFLFLCLHLAKIFSETVSWMKLTLCMRVNEISLYINCVFYSGRIRTLVAITTYSSHRLIMGKVEIDRFCRLIGDI